MSSIGADPNIVEPRSVSKADAFEGSQHLVVVRSTDNGNAFFAVQLVLQLGIAQQSQKKGDDILNLDSAEKALFNRRPKSRSELFFGYGNTSAAFASVVLLPPIRGA